MYNKKAQISDTITWFVATLVIIVILSISIFLVSSSGFFKGSREIETKQTDLLAMKSLSAYLQTEKDGEKIYDKLKEEGNLNEVNGRLAQNIFSEFYEKDYPSGVWFGIQDDSGYVSNNYFALQQENWINYLGEDALLNAGGVIKLTEDKNLVLFLDNGIKKQIK